MAAGRARAGAGGQRQHAQDEGERGHDDRPEAQASGFHGGVIDGAPLRWRCEANFDDQDGVLGGKADQRDQPDRK